MKIPLPFVCSACSEPATVKIHLDATSFDWTCQKCGEFHGAYLGLDVTVGRLILNRSMHELEIEQDYSLAILLAAASVDIELAGLYCKWRYIEALGNGTFVDADDNQRGCEQEMRSFRSAADTIRKVCALLYPAGTIEDYLISSPEWTQNLTRFPSLKIASFVEDIVQTLFWPRNKIIHQGYAKYSKNDGERCVSIAYLFLILLKDLDQDKRKTLPA